MSNARYDGYWKEYLDYYGIIPSDINSEIISSLTFKNIDKELKNYIKKNTDLLKKVQNEQLVILSKNKIKLKKFKLNI